MKILTIRGVDDALEKAIKKTSRETQKSMNQTVIKLLKQSVGLSRKPLFPRYNDLDELAGSWSSEDEALFSKNTQSFEEIDEGMWP